MHVHVDRSSRTALKTDGPHRPPPKSARYEVTGYRLAQTILTGTDLAVVKAATNIALEGKYKFPFRARMAIGQAARAVIGNYKQLAADARDGAQLRRQAQTIAENLDAIITGVPFNPPKAKAKQPKLGQEDLF